MDLSARVLGRSVVTYLVEQKKAVLLQIGRDRFDRAALAGVACFNFQAAARLSFILNRELTVKDTRDVFDRIHPDAIAVRGLGGVSLAVLGAAFQAKGIGGDTPLENWFLKHAVKIATFHTVKQRAAAEHAKEKKQIKARRLARRNIAHSIRVNRFESGKGIH